MEEKHIEEHAEEHAEKYTEHAEEANEKIELAQDLLEFINSSPTAIHAALSMSQIFQENGYVELYETDKWNLVPGGKYYVLKGDASIVAFHMGDGPVEENGFRLVGAHTDSPCLRIKPNPEKRFENYLSLGVDVYGGVLLSTWFDRDLSIAGRVTFEKKDGSIYSGMIDFQRPVAVLPNLAIHLNPKVNEKNSINKQKEMPPLLMQLDKQDQKKENIFNELLMDELIRKSFMVDEIERILSHDLCLYDTQKGNLVGQKKEFITSARLDNLLSCFTGIVALLESEAQATNVLVCNHHEEVGSTSNIGAAGPFLKSVLHRICGDYETFYRALAQSALISADNAHGIHPNYQDKHDENHGPILNAGPVIKTNVNQKYATNSHGSGIFQVLCQSAGVPVQNFVNRSDLGCGSTIGPITAAALGVRAIDVGAPTFGMHSIRETAGTDDVWYLFKALRAFYRY